MIRVAIANRQELVELDRPRLRDLVRRVLAGEGVDGAEISLAFVDDAAIRRLNKRFLDHDQPTDVISFPLSEPGSSPLVGELVISTETARRAARRLRQRVERELSLYVIHGLLHLCGYDDQGAKDRRRMRQREAWYLKSL